MKKLFALIVSSVLSLTAMAQQNRLVGMWQQLDSKGFPTTQVKVFMPDGKQLGLCYNSDFTNSSVWFMSKYTVLNDTSFVDQEFYHSNIAYQHDYYFTYHMENDSIMVTKYMDYRVYGNGVIMLERWKKMNRPMPSYTDDEWHALYLKSLKEFERLPKDGQTVEQYGKELNDKAQDYFKANKVDRGLELMQIRAELDSTKMDWQRELLDKYLELHNGSSNAIEIANRYIRLTEAQAPVPSDTSVLKAYRMKAYLYNYRGNAGLPQLRSVVSKVIDMETKAGHQPSKDFGLDYFMMVMGYLPEGNMEKVYEYSMKCIDIFEKSTDVSDNQKAEVYTMAGMARLLDEQQPREDEALVLLKKAAPMFSGETAFKVNVMVYPAMLQCYEDLIEKNPKDKKMKKELKQFMADKLLYDVFETTDKEHNLWGEYIVLEKGNWTLENFDTEDHEATHYLLQKGDEYRRVEVKVGEKLPGAANIRIVDPAMKKNIIKQWKAYKKGKKVKK